MTDETTQKKGPGRPRKHETKAARNAAYRANKVRTTGAVHLGVWVSAEAHAMLHARAAAWDCTLGEAASRLIMQPAGEATGAAPEAQGGA